MRRHIYLKNSDCSESFAMFLTKEEIEKKSFYSSAIKVVEILKSAESENKKVFAT